MLPKDLLEELCNNNYMAPRNRYSIRALVNWIDEGQIKLESKVCKFDMDTVKLIVTTIYKRLNLDFRICMCRGTDNNLLITQGQEIVAMIYMYYHNVFEEEFDVKDITNIKTFARYEITVNGKKFNIGMIDEDSSINDGTKNSFKHTDIFILLANNGINFIKEIYKII